MLFGFFENEFLFIGSFIYLSGLIASLLLIIFFILVPRTKNLEKNFAYECGFDPFEETRNGFDVKFYLVSLLFLVFDLEITFLFPWCVTLGNLGLLGYWVMIYFLVIVTLGFIYEWKKGVLEW